MPYTEYGTIENSTTSIESRRKRVGIRPILVLGTMMMMLLGTALVGTSAVKHVQLTDKHTVVLRKSPGHEKRKSALIKNLQTRSKLLINNPKLWTWEGYLEKWFSPKTDEVGSESMSNLRNVEYLIEIDIGTPPTTFKLIADTGSSNTWVSGSSCSSVGCSNMQKFYKKVSSTWRSSDKQFNLSYGTGSCSGVLGTDEVVVGGFNFRMSIGIATIVDSFFEKVPDTDGILGLGLGSLSAGNVPSLVDSMNQNYKIFSMYLSSSSFFPHHPSQITFGGTNPDLYIGTIDYVPLLRFKGAYLYYIIKFDGFWVDGHPVTMTCNPCRAVIDSGTSLLLGPSKHINNLLRSLANNGVLQVGINGILYSIPPSVYMLGNDMAIAEDTSMQDLFIFGDTILRSIYTVFDLDNYYIGLAPSIQMPLSIRY